MGALANHVFVFKQKTAYEIGPYDWSSDVCSSDLHEAWAGPREGDIGDKFSLEHLAREDRKSVV